MRLVFLSILFLTISLYAQNGTLRTSFGDMGKKTIDIDALDELVGLLSDEMGNTYFYGNTSSDGGGVYPFDIYIGKLDANGNLDLNFGANGIFRADFPGFNISSLTEAVYDTSGIYFIGNAVNQGVPDTNTLFIGKVDLQGEIDLSFANNGFFSSSFLGAYNTPGSLIIDKEGKLVFCGSTTDDGGTYYEYSLIGRMDKNGVPDSTFGTTGFQIWDYYSGTWINGMQLPEYYMRHGDGAYLTELIEVNNKYYACGMYITTSYAQIQLMSISKAGDFNTDFLSAAPLVFQIDPGYNHFIRDIEYYNGKLLLALETDGPLYNGKELIQVIDTMGMMGPTLSFDHNGNDCITNVLKVDNDRIYFGGYSLLPASSSPGYWSDNFLVYAIGSDFASDLNFGVNGYFESNLNSDDELGMESMTFHDGFSVLGGYMNNLTAGNYTDLAFMAIDIDPFVSGDELHLTGLNVFPNPCTAVVHFESKKEIKAINIYSLSGELVFEATYSAQQMIQVETLNLPNGQYIASVKIGDSTQFIPFIKS